MRDRENGRAGAPGAELPHPPPLLYVVVLAALLCGCSKTAGPGEQPGDDEPNLPSTSLQIIADVGGTVGVEGYTVEFPPGSLSEDAVVTIGSPETNPPNPSHSHLERASLFLSVETGSAAVVDTFLILIPYENEWSEVNPPVAIAFGADGRVLELPYPARGDDHVILAIAPQSRRAEMTVCLFEYVEEVEDYALTVAQGGNFDWESSNPVALLIHGYGGSAEDFNEYGDPEPTMRDFLYENYGGRLWTWEYPSTPSIATTGSALVEAIAALESAHGPFPFKLHIIAHSRGGLEARYFVRQGGYTNTRHVVFLGTPNDGAYELAYLYHVSSPPSRESVDWVNPWSLGFLDCLHGSEFLGQLNTPTSWINLDLHYHAVAGDYQPENPYAPGPDDHFISVSSVDILLVPHERVSCWQHPAILNLYHGQLVENRNDGGGAGSDTYSDLFLDLRRILSIYGTEEPDSEITEPAEPSGTLVVPCGEVVQFSWVARDPEEQEGLPSGIMQVSITLDSWFQKLIDCPPDYGEWWFSSSVDPTSEHYIPSMNYPTGGNRPHTFTVMARDVEGQWETPSSDPEDREVYTFSYNYPPTTEVLSPSEGEYVGSSFAVTWEGVDVDGEAVQYQYVLDPKENAWRLTDKETVSYEDILPGEHEFRIRAQDNAGCWEEETNVVTFYVE